eukprot:470072_1
MLSVLILYGLIMTLTNAGWTSEHLCKLQLQSCGPGVTTVANADYYCNPYPTSRCKFPDQIVVANLAGPSACCNNDFCCFANEATQDSIGCTTSAQHASVCKTLMDASNTPAVTPAPTTSTTTTTATTSTTSTTSTTPGSTASTSSTTTTTLQPGTRDCSVLAIDEFLLQCSSEFPLVQQQGMDLDNRINTLETNLQTQITQNTNDITQVQNDLNSGNSIVTTEIQQLQTDVDNVNARIDLFAAKAVGNFNIDGNNGNNNNGLGFTDGIIIILLIVNFMTMSYIYCWKKNNSVNNKKHYALPIDDCDVEQLNQVKM